MPLGGGVLPAVPINQLLHQAADLGLRLCPLGSLASASDYLMTQSQIAAAFNAALGRHLEVPPGFAVVMDGTFIVPADATCWFHGDSHVYNIGASKSVLVEIGDSSQRYFNKNVRIGAVWSSTSDWLDGNEYTGGETSIAVRVYQPQSSSVHVHIASGCTIGVQLASYVGSQDAIFDFSGRGIVNAKVPVDIHSFASGGYANENVFHNYKSHVDTGVGTGLPRYGYRFMRESGGSTSMNGNQFTGRQLFEAAGYQDAECAPFLVLNGGGIGKATAIRSEGMPPVAAVYRNDAWGLDVYHGASRTPQMLASDFDENTSLAHGIARGWWHQGLNAKATWNSGIIPDLAVITASGGSDYLCVPGMSIWHSAFTGGLACRSHASGFAVTDGYLAFGSTSNGIGVKVDTRFQKQVMASYDRDVRVNNGGRPFVICYDADGNRLGGQSTSLAGSIISGANNSGLEFTSTAHGLEAGSVIKIEGCDNPAYNWLQKGECTVAAGGTGGSARVTTSATHYLQAGDWITLQSTATGNNAGRYRVRAYVDATHFDIDAYGFSDSAAYYRAKIRHRVASVTSNTFITHRTFNGTAGAAGTFKNLALVKGRSGQTWSPSLTLFPSGGTGGKTYISGSDGLTDRLAVFDDLVDYAYIGAYRCAIRSMKLAGLDPCYPLNVTAGHAGDPAALYGASAPTEGTYAAAENGTVVRNYLMASGSDPWGWVKNTAGWSNLTP